MQSLRKCRALLARLPNAQALHSGACQASSGSSLERFIAGKYDPVADGKKRDDGPGRGRGDGEGRQQQGGRFSNRNQQPPGQEARRQALGHTRQRAAQGQNEGRGQSGEGRGQYTGGRGRGQYGGRNQGQQQEQFRLAGDRQGRGDGEQQGSGRGRGRGAGRSFGRGPRGQHAGPVAAASPNEIDQDDIVDERLEEPVGAAGGRRMRQPGRRASTSMMGTISDDRGVITSSRRPGAPGGRGRMGSEGFGRGRMGAEGFGRGRGRGRALGGRGRGRGMEAFGGRGRGDGGRRSGFGHKKVLGPGEEGSEDNAGKEDRHPDDMIDGIEEDDEWNLIEEMKGHQASIPSGTGTDNESHAYTVDADGITVENVWEDMSYPELRHQLIMEMTYSRHDHELWLRGTGRPDLEAARKEVGQGLFTEEEFEEEVTTQMELFNRHTWIDDLYYFAKQQQINEKVERSVALAEAELAEMGALFEASERASEAEGDEAEDEEEASENLLEASSSPFTEKDAKLYADTLQVEASESSVEVSSGAEQVKSEDVSSEAAVATRDAELAEMHASDDTVQDDEDEYLTEEQARERGLLEGPLPTEKEAQEGVDDALKSWMTQNTRQSMREARMLRKFWGIRETARIGITPRRKGSEFNRKEFDMAVLDKMVEMLEPDRPRNMQGNFLSERQAVDANKAMLFDSHPEMMPHFERPELFPATTLESMSRENFDERMDASRDEIYHPLAGLHSEEDWQELKDMAYEKLPELMQKRVQMHQRVGFSGLMGGYMEDRAYLEEVAREIMPEDHPNDNARMVFTDKIANNAQWAWPYKIRAVAMTAKFLLIGSEFADERRREEEEGGNVEGAVEGAKAGLGPAGAAPISGA